jgi:hypothetical protein
VLIFPIFATLVWALAMYWRRRWPSFAIVTGAMIALLIVVRIFAAWRDALPVYSPIFYELMWPYIILTGALGYYICCLPRPPTGLQCGKCRYDLSGLNLKDLTCPECGEPWRGQGSGFEPPPVVLTPILKTPPPKRRVM